MHTLPAPAGLRIDDARERETLLHLLRQMLKGETAVRPHKHFCLGKPGLIHRNESPPGDEGGIDGGEVVVVEIHNGKVLRREENVPPKLCSEVFLELFKQLRIDVA